MTKNDTISPQDSFKKLKKKPLVSSKSTDQNTSARTKGLSHGWTRSTFLVREDHLKKLKTLAFMGQTTLKDVIEHILENFLANKNIRTGPNKNLDEVLQFLEKKADD